MLITAKPYFESWIVTRASGRALPTAIIVIPKYEDGILVMDPKKVKLSIKTPENK